LYEGEHNGKVGTFPASYVKMLPMDDIVSSNCYKKNINDVKSKIIENLHHPNTQAKPITLHSLQIFNGSAALCDNQTPNYNRDLNGFPEQYVNEDAYVSKHPFDLYYNQRANDEYNNNCASEVDNRIISLYTTNISSRPISVLSDETFINGFDYSIRSAEAYPEFQREDMRLANDRHFALFQSRYNYNPKEADELELHEGDVICVSEQFDDGWWYGLSHRTNRQGTFPGNYVQPLR